MHGSEIEWRSKLTVKCFADFVNDAAAFTALADAAKAKLGK